VHRDAILAEARAQDRTVGRSTWRLVGPGRVAETGEQACRGVECGVEQRFHDVEVVAPF
jgi:hypothetical protein